jgi:Tol biopolymer transport system component
MAIQPGNHLGPYEILSAIGAGGMGEVYRARDTRLDRIVAIKVLPVHLADRPESRERFEREARTIAGLNHPHICTLFDVGHQDGTDYLVMEYLEGETLAQRLTKGPLPLQQVLQYAIEIADALDKAHRKGVTHRDLKPGNIMLTKSGTKLLDFGLAKLQQEVAPNIQISQSPTMSQPLTAQGTIVGTLQYMAPEQLEGKEVDARTDIFAFGTVVYEMATGKRAFEGKSQASVISAIMSSEPAAMSSLQPMTPPALDRVVKKCLAKEPDDRWQSAHDVTDELKWIAEGGSQVGLTHPVTAKGSRARWRGALPWATTVALAIVAAFFAFSNYHEKPLAPTQLLRYQIFPPEKASFGAALALSPDGRHLAFTATVEGGPSQLWVRDLDTLEARPLPGTEGANDPFWSPDNRVLGFGVGSHLTRVDVSGGVPQMICDASGAVLGGAWNQDGVIVFGSYAGLMRVSAAGGTPSFITKVDRSRGEVLHADPSFLPDGRRFLYRRYPGAAGTYVGSLDAGPEQQDSKRLLAASGIYAPTPGQGPGHILFLQDGTLMAQNFDASRMELEGDPTPIVQQVTHASVSASGVLAYIGGGAAPVQLTWFDRQGMVLGRLGEPGIDPLPAISPDGSAVVVPRIEGEGRDLWLYNLARGTQSRLTFDGKANRYPVWSPDSSHIAFVSTRDGGNYIYQKAINGIGQDETLDRTPANVKVALDWSRDGRYLIEGVITDAKASLAIWMLPLSPEQKDGDRRPFPYLNEGFNQIGARLSPNGQWIAYVSEETKRYEIFVQTFPRRGGKWPVSTNGGTRPRWSHDGKELYFIGLDGKLMAVVVKSGPDGGFEAGAPKALFDSHISGDQFTWFDVAKDGRFLIPTVVEQSGAPITVVVNWTAELNK